MLHALQIMSLALATASPMPAASVGPAAAVQHELSEGVGLQVVVDPVTGEIIDNPEPFQLDRLSEGIDRRRRSSWDLETFFLKDGGRGVFLDGWADHSLTVQVGPDGEMTVGCQQGARQGDARHRDHRHRDHRPGDHGHDEPSGLEAGDGREAVR